MPLESFLLHLPSLIAAYQFSTTFAILLKKRISFVDRPWCFRFFSSSSSPTAGIGFLWWRNRSISEIRTLCIQAGPYLCAKSGTIALDVDSCAHYIYDACATFSLSSSSSIQLHINHFFGICLPYSGMIRWVLMYYNSFLIFQNNFQK